MNKIYRKDVVNMCKEIKLIKGAYEFLGVNEKDAEQFSTDIVERVGIEDISEMTVEEIVDLVSMQIKNDLEEEFLGCGHADKILEENSEIEMLEFNLNKEDDILDVILRNISLDRELVETKYKEKNLNSFADIKNFLEKDLLEIANIEDQYCDISIYAKEESDILKVKVSYIKEAKHAQKIFKRLKMKSIVEIKNAISKSKEIKNAYLWLNRGDICIKFIIDLDSETDRNTVEADLTCMYKDIFYYKNGESIYDKKLDLLLKELNI